MTKPRRNAHAYALAEYVVNQLQIPLTPETREDWIEGLTIRLEVAIDTFFERRLPERDQHE